MARALKNGTVDPRERTLELREALAQARAHIVKIEEDLLGYEEAGVAYIDKALR